MGLEDVLTEFNAQEPTAKELLVRTKNIILEKLKIMILFTV